MNSFNYSNFCSVCQLVYNSKKELKYTEQSVLVLPKTGSGTINDDNNFVQLQNAKYFSLKKQKRRILTNGFELSWEIKTRLQCQPLSFSQNNSNVTSKVGNRNF